MHINFKIVKTLHINTNVFIKKYIFKKISHKSGTALYFANIFNVCTFGLIGGSWIFINTTAFDWLKYIVKLEIPEENLASYTYFVGKEVF